VDTSAPEGIGSGRIDTAVYPIHRCIVDVGTAARLSMR